jgi:hypothetical protein
MRHRQTGGACANDEDIDSVGNVPISFDDFPAAAE